MEIKEKEENCFVTCSISEFNSGGGGGGGGVVFEFLSRNAQHCQK